MDPPFPNEFLISKIDSGHGISAYRSLIQLPRQVLEKLTKTPLSNPLSNAKERRHFKVETVGEIQFL